MKLELVRKQLLIVHFAYLKDRMEAPAPELLEVEDHHHHATIEPGVALPRVSCPPYRRAQ